MHESGNPILGLITIAILFFFYWFPSLLAARRHHRDKGSICLVNFFFGWTVIGWIIALVWAASGNVEVHN